jgi:hypothetical protein
MGHTGKYREVAFYKITRYADARVNAVLKDHKRRRRNLRPPPILDDDRIHASDDYRTHCVSPSQFPA